MLEVNATSQGDVELSVEKGEILLKPLTTAVRFSKGRAAVLSLSSGRFYHISVVWPPQPPTVKNLVLTG